MSDLKVGASQYLPPPSTVKPVATPVNNDNQVVLQKSDGLNPASDLKADLTGAMATGDTIYLQLTPDSAELYEVNLTKPGVREFLEKKLTNPNVQFNETDLKFLGSLLKQELVTENSVRIAPTVGYNAVKDRDKFDDSVMQVKKSEGLTKIIQTDFNGAMAKAEANGGFVYLDVGGGSVQAFDLKNPAIKSYFDELSQGFTNDYGLSAKTVTVDLKKLNALNSEIASPSGTGPSATTGSGTSPSSSTTLAGNTDSSSTTGISSGTGSFSTSKSSGSTTGSSSTTNVSSGTGVSSTTGVSKTKPVTQPLQPHEFKGIGSSIKTIDVTESQGTRTSAQDSIVDLTTPSALSSPQAFESAYQKALAQQTTLNNAYWEKNKEGVLKGMTKEEFLKSDYASALVFKVKLSDPENGSKTGGEFYISMDDAARKDATYGTNNHDRILNQFRTIVKQTNTPYESNPTIYRAKLNSITFELPWTDANKGTSWPGGLSGDFDLETRSSATGTTNTTGMDNKALSPTQTIEDMPFAQDAKADVKAWTGVDLTASKGFDLENPAHQAGLRTMFDNYLVEGNFKKAEYQTDAGYKDLVNSKIANMMSDAGAAEAIKLLGDPSITTKEQLAARCCDVFFNAGGEGDPFTKNDIKAVQATFFAMSATRPEYKEILDLKSSATSKTTANEGIDGIPAIRFAVVTRTLLIGEEPKAEDTQEAKPIGAVSVKADPQNKIQLQYFDDAQK